MKNKYICHTTITKEILDTINVGDLVKINDWKKPMRVRAVSDNYFVMTQNIFGSIFYSVCEKIAWNGIKHNNMIGGMFHCGTDNWLFGSPLTLEYENLYAFDNEEANREYLQEFEEGKCELSHRSSVPIHSLYVKKEDKR